MGLKGKIFKFMTDILKDGSYYKLYIQAKSTSACGLPKGFFKYLRFNFLSFKVKDLSVGNVHLVIVDNLGIVTEHGI